MGCVSGKGTGGGGGEGTAEGNGAAGAGSSNKEERGNARKATAGGSVHKLILLGAGESGKSTVFKQMKLINLGETPPNERMAYTALISVATLQQMVHLCRAILQLRPDLRNDDVQALSEVTVGKSLSDNDYCSRLKRVWSITAVRDFFGESRGALTISDGAPYLFENAHRFVVPDFVPSDEDMLRVRVRTAGTDSVEYSYEGARFHVWDVGGQRSERRHWRTCIEGASAMIYMAPLSEYDQHLREDQTRNRFEETMLLWEEIVNSHVIRNMSLILFLNKADVLREKLATATGAAAFRTRFPKFQQETVGFDACAGFLKEEFMRCKPKTVAVYAHIVTATDTANIRRIWKDMVDIFRRELIDGVL